MNLQNLAEMAYACGLSTFDEALHQAYSHWDAFPPGALEELEQEIAAAGPDDFSLDMLCVHFLGAERCAEMDKELDDYFNSAAARADVEFNL